MISIENGENSNSNIYSGESLPDIMLLSTLGWTPTLWRQVKERKCLSASALFVLFLIDLADAIFDFILGTRTITLGEDGVGIGFGIFLIVATILGRIISGLYGRMEAIDPTPPEYTFSAFAWMEMAVFFVEDGAAILVLTNDTGGLDIVETISIFLTVICGVCYIVHIAIIVGKDALEDGLRALDPLFIVFVVLGVGSVVFQSYILISQVILSKDDDAPLSGGLEITAFVVYGITALCVGGYATVGFLSDALY